MEKRSFFLRRHTKNAKDVNFVELTTENDPKRIKGDKTPIKRMEPMRHHESPNTGFDSITQNDFERDFDELDHTLSLMNQEGSLLDQTTFDFKLQKTVMGTMGVSMDLTFDFYCILALIVAFMVPFFTPFPQIWILAVVSAFTFCYGRFLPVRKSKHPFINDLLRTHVNFNLKRTQLMKKRLLLHNSIVITVFLLMLGCVFFNMFGYHTIKFGVIGLSVVIILAASTVVLPVLIASKTSYYPYISYFCFGVFSLMLNQTYYINRIVMVVLATGIFLSVFNISNLPVTYTTAWCWVTFTVRVALFGKPIPVAVCCIALIATLETLIPFKTYRKITYTLSGSLSLVVLGAFSGLWMSGFGYSRFMFVVPLICLCGIVISKKKIMTLVIALLMLVFVVVICITPFSAVVSDIVTSDEYDFEITTPIGHVSIPKPKIPIRDVAAAEKSNRDMKKFVAELGLFETQVTHLKGKINDNSNDMLLMKTSVNQIRKQIGAIQRKIAKSLRPVPVDSDSATKTELSDRQLNDALSEMREHLESLSDEMIGLSSRITVQEGSDNSHVVDRLTMQLSQLKDSVGMIFTDIEDVRSSVSKNSHKEDLTTRFANVLSRYLNPTVTDSSTPPSLMRKIFNGEPEHNRIFSSTLEPGDCFECRIPCYVDVELPQFPSKRHELIGFSYSKPPAQQLVSTKYQPDAMKVSCNKRNVVNTLLNDGTTIAMVDAPVTCTQLRFDFRTSNPRVKSVCLYRVKAFENK
ncbi:hypothetical protein PCE1_001555 [Barthelona sp. PCE]